MSNQNGNNQNMNVGLNLNGNALATVQTLVSHMQALRQAAVDVGSAMQVIEKANLGMTAKELKQLQLQMKTLTTNPQQFEKQYYNSIRQAGRTRQVTDVVNSTRQLHNPNTMNSMLNTYGSTVVKEGLEVRLGAAQIANDTKAIKKAQREMDTYKAELVKYNQSLKGLSQLKAEHDRMISAMLATPVGAAALNLSTQSGLDNKYKVGARQKQINSYMANPSSIQPSNRDWTTATAADIKQAQIDNASKLEATQRLMGKSILEGTKASKAEYDLQVKTVALLEQEKQTLQYIAGLKRNNMRLQSLELRHLKQMNDAEKASQRLGDLAAKGFNVKTLTPERIMMLPKENLLEREIAMKFRLKDANETLRLSESLGNKQAIKDSRAIVIAYEQELKAIARRKVMLEAPVKAAKNPNLVDHYMANPQLLKPKANISSTMTADQITEAQYKNSAKIQAVQGIINKLNMDGSDQAKADLAIQMKTLAALTEEKARLNAINNARRTGVNLQDQELKAIRETNDNIKASERLNQLVNKKGFSVKTLDAARIENMPLENVYQRELSMVKRLAQAKSAMSLADSLNNKKALDDSTKLVLAYEAELRLLRQRIKEATKVQVERETPKTNPMVDRYHQMAEGESSGALLGIQGLLMRNYMLWGAFMGSIYGSYAFLRDYEQALKQTQAISQATNTQVAELNKQILNIAENSRFSAIEITDAATTLAQAGFSMSDIGKTLESVTLLATATGSTLKETVDIATASLGAFQLSAENMPRIVNQITQAMNLSKLDIQKFQLAVQYAGNAASDAGLNFEELLSSVATVANAGVRSGSTLGTGFRQLLSDLISPSAKFEKILHRLGLTTADVDVRTNGLVGTLKQLKDAGFSTSDAYESFEVRSVAFYTALANNLSTYDDLLSNLDSNTAAMDANEIQMGSLSAQTDRMFNQFKALAEVLGAPLREALTGVFNVIGDVLIVVKDLTDNGIARAVLQFAVFTGTVAGTVVLVKGIVVTLVGLATTLGLVGKAATVAATGIGAAAASTTALGVATKAFNPLLLVLSATVAGAAIAVKTFSGSNKDLKKAIEESQTAVNGLKDAANALQNTVAETDKKIVSLESRFESLKDDPAAVAVEMSNLQNKATELGISLETNLNNGIQSVIDGWRELRLELGKEIVMNLDRQFEELNLLSERMALLRSQEARKEPRFDSERWGSEKGIGFIASATNLAKSGSTRAPVDVDVNGFRVQMENKAGASLRDVLAQVATAESNRKNGLTVDKMYGVFTKLDDVLKNLDSYSPEEIVKHQAAWNKEASMVLTGIRAYSSQMRYFINNSKYSKEVQENARKSLETLTATAQIVQDYQNRINSAAQPARGARTANTQSSVQNYENRYSEQANNLRNLPIQDHKKLKYNDVRLDSYIVDYGKKTGNEWAIPLLLAIKNEGEKSNMSAVSKVGAQSVMQFMPKTWNGNNGARGYKVDPKTGRIRDINNAADTIEAAFQMVNDLKKHYKTDDPRVIAAHYNGGFAAGNNVKRGGAGIVNRDGTRENIDYVARVGSLIHKYQDYEGYLQNRMTGKNQVKSTSTRKLSAKDKETYTVVEQLEIPENAEFALQRKAHLENQREEVSRVLKELGDVEKYTEEDKKKAEDYRNRIAALDKIIAQASSETVNTLRNSQLKHQEQAKIRDKKLKLDEQRQSQTIERIEAEIAATERIMETGNYSQADEKELNLLYKKLGDSKKQLAKTKNQIAVNMMYEYKEDQVLTDKNLKTMADEALVYETEKITTELTAKREKALTSARDAFIQRVVTRNADFVRDLKNALEENQYEFEKASATAEFGRVMSERQLRESTGLGKLERERALMDDIRYRDQYTDTQRNALDKAIEKLVGQISRDMVIFDEAQAAMNRENIAKVNALITEAEAKRTAHEAAIVKSINDSGLTQAQKKTTIDKLEKELNAVRKELNKYQDELYQLEQRANEYDDAVKAKTGTDMPTKATIPDLISNKIDLQYAELFKASTLDNNITTVIQSVNTAFSDLISTALTASDSFDDFFKILIGGSHESKEAFKAFGYGILQTMMKILQDAIVTKFLKTMKDIYMGSETGQAANGWIGKALGTIGTVIGGAFTKGAAPAAAAATPTVTYMSQGGVVRGSNKNVDDVPIMGADMEYMLPSNVTETVGLGFLENLRKDPAGFMNSKFNVNNITAGKSEPSLTNVYVVSPDNVPTSLTQNDIIVAVEDNVARGGSLKQLIKQVVNNG